MKVEEIGVTCRTHGGD